MDTAENMLIAGVSLRIDRSSGRPLHQQLSSALASAIESGAMRSGERLATETALSEHLGLSRFTVRQALQELVDRGLLIRRRGVGTQVVNSDHLAPTRSLEDEIDLAGTSESYSLVSASLIDPPFDVTQKCGPGQIMALRWAASDRQGPVAILDSFIPQPHFAPQAKSEHAPPSLTLALSGVFIRLTRQLVGARRATRHERDLLALPSGSAVLTVTRTSYGAAGTIVEIGRQCIRPGRYHVESRLIAP